MTRAFERRAFFTTLGGLDFTVSIPVDWVEESVSQTPPDFANPIALQPLVVLHDAEHKLTLTIDARPASEHDNLRKWAHALQEARLLSVYSLETHIIGSTQGASGTATDESTGERTPVRFAFLERNQHIVRISLTTAGRLPIASGNTWTEILESFRFADEPVTHKNAASQEWWTRAKELEIRNKFSEAEATIREAVPHLGAVVQTATLYAERMKRLIEAGDLNGAAEAHAKASEWITDYASYATSGGEAAALSYERELFLKKLGPTPRTQS